MSKIKFKGFPIVELLVVIIIIGVLSTVAVISYAGVRKKAYDTGISSDIDRMDLSQLKYKYNTGAPGQAYYSGTGYSSTLDYKSTSGNIIDVVVGSSGYCIRGYNPKGTYSSIDNALTRESSVGVCAMLPASTEAGGPVGSYAIAYGGTNADYGQDIFKTVDGGYIITGSMYSFSAGSDDMFISKYTSTGTLSWTKMWGGSGSDEGNSVIQTNDGGYAVIGETGSYGAGLDDVFLAKYTSDGTLSWSKTWGGTGNDRGRSIIQTSDSGYVITGNTNSYGAGNADMLIAKYTSDGTLSWSKTWGGTGYDYGYSIVQASDGGYAVTGYTGSFGAGNDDLILVKYTSDGTLSWSKTWGSTSSDQGNLVVKTSDNGYAVVGNGLGGVILAKYTSDGTLSWSKAWDGPSIDMGTSLIQSSDDGYVMVGITFSYGAGMDDLFIAKYTSDGTLSWFKTWGGATSEMGYGVVQSNDGSYTVVGATNSFGAGSYDSFLVRFTSNGDMTDCAPTMCYSPSPTVTSPSPTVTSPSPTVTSPSPTVTSPSPTVNSPTLDSNIIVEL